MLRRSALAIVVLLALTATAAAQGAAIGRVQGKVVDADGSPVEDVQITITSPELPSYSDTATTNRKGKFLVSHVDATKVYTYRFEKEGYQPLSERVKPQMNGVLRREFVLQPAGAGQAAPQQLTGEQRAIMTYNEGAQAQVQGDLDLAERRFREALEIDPGLSAAHSGLAAVALMRENFDEALAQAEDALALDPADSRALEVRYEAAKSLGRDEVAAEALQALQATGGSDPARRAFNAGAEALRAGDTATAEARFAEALQLDPTLVPAYRVLAGLALQQGDAARAAELADTLLELEPGNVEALKLRYDAARRLGQADAAEQCLVALRETDPDWVAEDLFDHAVEEFNAGNLEAAKAELEQVLAVRPDLARAHFVLGMALFNTGEAEAATEHLERFLELAPDDPDAATAREILSYAGS